MKTFKNLDATMAEIARLQILADEFRQRERASVLERVRKAIQEYKLTGPELRGEVHAPAALPTADAPQEPSLSEKMRSRVKYRLNDLTWSGYGKPPVWVRGYLVEKGTRIEDLLTPEFK